VDRGRDAGWARLTVEAPKSVYDDLRFSERDQEIKEGVWREIGRYLQRYIPPDAVVMDLAADRGHFIRHIQAREKWASDLRDTSQHMSSDVRFVQANGLELAEHVEAGYFDVVFMSNYLEHLESPDAVVEQFRVVYGLVRPGGRVMVLQPNIKLVGSGYWDFIDHRVALTERSLVEAASMAGFRTAALTTRFLPYSVKSRLPTHPALVRAYLAFRPAWWFMGRQTLYLGERPG
jgi:2-polyprenyl-3-methyl-5-hydroxy-6-metoxy-1,4-benzoquinol methylase